MLIKIHKTYRDVVAICDKELLGKIFEQDKFQLDIKESFFKGEKSSKENAIKIMQNMSREDATFNIVGEKSIQLALQEKILDQDSIGYIAISKWNNLIFPKEPDTGCMPLSHIESNSCLLILKLDFFIM